MTNATERAQRSDARENRQRLLEAAKELFGQQGVEATSMQEIAKAAGVGQGTLYRHFADKAELCHALIEEDIAAFQARLEVVLASNWVIASPMERLDLLISEKVKLVESHLPLLAVMDLSNKSKRSGPGSFYHWQREQIVALLHEAVELGELAPLDVEYTTEALLAILSPRLYSHQHNELGYTSERVIAGIRRLFVEGLR
jgi:AcrR family transcriptional regulator